MIDDIWGLAWYGDALYVASMAKVFMLDNGTLRGVDFGACVPEASSLSRYCLSAADGVLW